MRAIKSKRVITAEKKGRVWKIGANERNANLFVITQRMQPNLAVRKVYVKKQAYIPSLNNFGISSL